MDEQGIGTDATIHEHIQKIQNRLYALKDEKGYFSPTEAGIDLIEAYKHIGIELYKPFLWS